MTRIVVTGASGFLGRHVCADLETADHHVVRVGRRADGALHDLATGRTEGIFDGADGVVHLAAALAEGPGTPIAHYLQPNVALTEQVLLAGIGVGATTFVFSSSRLVYPSDLGRPATEGDTPHPESAYGMSKYLAEQVIAHHGERHPIRTTALRISQLVGPGDGDRGALARFAAAARSGSPISVSGAGVAVRDVLDVRDAARAVRLALATLGEGGAPPAVNVGGGGRTIRQLAEIAATAAGRELGAIDHVEVDVEDRSHWSLDSSLAEETFGWRPEIDLVEALRHRWAVGET